MPLFARGELFLIRDFVDRVEMEVVGKVVHAADLLLARHLQPLLHVDTKMGTLLLQGHLGPFISVEVLRAGRVAGLLRDDLGSLPASSLASCRWVIQSFASIRVLQSAAYFLIYIFISVRVTEDIEAFGEAFLATTIPDLRLRHFVVSLLFGRRRLDDSSKEPL